MTKQKINKVTKFKSSLRSLDRLSLTLNYPTNVMTSFLRQFEQFFDNLNVYSLDHACLSSKGGSNTGFCKLPAALQTLNEHWLTGVVASTNYITEY